MNEEKDKYRIGDRLLITEYPEDRGYEGKTGTILYIDRDGALEGTWGDEILTPSSHDEKYEIVGHEKVPGRIAAEARKKSLARTAKLMLWGQLHFAIPRLIMLHWFREYDASVDPWIGEGIGILTNVVDDREPDERRNLTPEGYDEAVAELLAAEKFAERYRNALEFFVHAYVEISPKCAVPAPKRSQDDCAKARRFVAEYLAWARPLVLARKKIDCGDARDLVKTKVLEMMGRIRD